MKTTKQPAYLVELRNPLPNEELRPPLLVFVPNDSLRADRISSEFLVYA